MTNYEPLVPTWGRPGGNARDRRKNRRAFERRRRGVLLWLQGVDRTMEVCRESLLDQVTQESPFLRWAQEYPGPTSSHPST